MKVAVNNMLKAITASLLMEQVLAPNFKFRTRRSDEDEPDDPSVLVIGGFVEPSTDRVKQIIDDDLNDIKAKLFQDQQMLKAMPGNVDPEVMNKVMIPNIIRMAYPDLSSAEVEQVRQAVVVDSVIKNSDVKEVGDKRLILMANKFININELNIDLIDSVNPFQRAFEILSTKVTKQLLKVIQDAIDEMRVDITEDEAKISSGPKSSPSMPKRAESLMCAHTTRSSGEWLKHSYFSRRSGGRRTCEQRRSGLAPADHR
ncbi:MAG: hypothetical protein NTX07_04600 [Solirubrobacterales bacterium]|nr:hypothetical protein [Solirubrobacterales bacterium]